MRGTDGPGEGGAVFVYQGTALNADERDWLTDARRGANLILTAEAGRGKNYVCDAVSSALPEEFYLAFESASAKILYYRAENDPQILKHRWIYPNEAEATDELVELFRPLLSGGKASHLTVNKTGEGRNAAQELNIEGPASMTIPTVRNKLDAQLQTRMLVAELPDYDGRVAEHSRAVSRQLLPENAGEDHGPKVRAWRMALKSLAAVRRVVFDLDRYEFCFDSDTVSHGARLWANLLGLMLAHAWLEQRNRQVRDLSDGERAIVATPDDYETAYNVFKATRECSVVNLSDTHRKILDAVYELKEQSSFADGYSLGKIAEKTGIHHSTVAEHKTYLTKSAKLLREGEGGLDLVADAEPSWWQKGDLLLGFPRPEQVLRWWEEGGYSASESARPPDTPKVRTTIRLPMRNKLSGTQPDTLKTPPDSPLVMTTCRIPKARCQMRVPTPKTAYLSRKRATRTRCRACRAVSRKSTPPCAYMDARAARAVTCATGNIRIGLRRLQHKEARHEPTVQTPVPHPSRAESDGSYARAPQHALQPRRPQSHGPPGGRRGRRAPSHRGPHGPLLR
jgi:hypothetical protein